MIAHIPCCHAPLNFDLKFNSPTCEPSGEYPWHTHPEVWYNEDMTSYKMCDDTGEDETCSDSLATWSFSVDDHTHYYDVHISEVCKEFGIMKKKPVKPRFPWSDKEVQNEDEKKT
eukprot:UN31727